MAAERSNSDVGLWAGPVSVPNYHPPHRQMVSEVQVALIWVPKKTTTGMLKPQY